MIKVSRFLITIFILGMLILPFSLAASNFDVTIDTLTKDIYPNESATYRVNITNNMHNTETFLFSSSTLWIRSLDGSMSNVAPGETRSVILLFKARSVVKPGKSYSVSLSIEGSISGISKTFNIPIYLKSHTQDYGEYVPSINLYTDYDVDVDPTEKFNVNVRVKNLNARDITEMYVVVNSNIFSKSIIETLPPLQEKTFQFTFDLDPLEKPIAHQIESKIIINNKTYASAEGEFTILSYSDISVEQVKSREFLRTINKLNAKNNGNVKSTKTLEVQKNWVQRIFIYSDEDYTTVKSGDAKVIQWKLSLEPNEEISITYSSNYRLLFAICILIALVLYLYYTLRAPVIIVKKAKILHTPSVTEGVSRVKVKLFLKNRTGKKVNDVEVLERISKLMGIIEEKNNLGSPKPNKIIKGKTIILAKWNFEALDPFEERIITYKLESKLKLVGSIEFPGTTVKFKNQDGKIRRTKSNKLILSLIQQITSKKS